MLKNKNNFEIINSFFHCWAEIFSNHLRNYSQLHVSAPSIGKPKHVAESSYVKYTLILIITIN
jgi:hypothetical protein